MVEYIDIKKEEIRPDHIGQTFLFDRDNSKEFGIIFNVSERGVEVLFASSKRPLLLGFNHNSIENIQRVIFN